MSAHLDFLQHNTTYATDFGEKSSLKCTPSKSLTIVTCMDARLETFQQLGNREGDANVIRNAGGTVKDALRSILISQRLLGTREIAVFRHTDCGMLTFSTPQFREIIKIAHPGNLDVAKHIDSLEFLEFNDIEESVRSDVNFLKENPLVLCGTKITGWIYYVETGKVRQII